MIFVDTDIIVDVLRNFPPARTWFSSLTSPPTVSGFVVMEAIQGCTNKLEMNRTLNFMSSFDVVWPDESTCELGLDFYQQFYLSHGLGLLDSLIAATAIAQNTELLTFNTKHYQPIPSLTIRQPYVRA